MSNEIHVDFVKRNDIEIGIVRLGKEFTTITADEFRKQMAILMGRSIRFIIVDFEPVEFIDSTGLGAIISSTKLIRDLRGDVKLAALQSAVSNTFHSIHANRFFPTYESVEHALENYEHSDLPTTLPPPPRQHPSLKRFSKL